MTGPLRTLADRLGFDLRELPGSQIFGEIPVPEALVNRLIAQRLVNHPKIAALVIQPLPDDRVAIEIVPRAKLSPALQIDAFVERQPAFPLDPVLILRWSMGGGPLARLVAPALSSFAKMRPGIKLEGDRLSVDARALLEAQGQGDLLPFVRGLAIHTQAGAFLLRFEIGV